ARTTIIKGVSANEEEYERARTIQLKTVIGRERLAAGGFQLNYIPNRTGRRMWCHCYIKELRKQFIKKWKKLREEAREVLHRWRQGDFSLPFPPGLFPPRMPKLVEPLPSF